MDGIDPNAFKYAVGIINDGFDFEKFGIDFLAKVFGHEFIPAGGIRENMGNTSAQ